LSRFRLGIEGQGELGLIELRVAGLRFSPLLTRSRAIEGKMTGAPATFASLRVCSHLMRFP
jgi:hypothetical protein